MNKDILNSVTRSFGRAKLTVMKHSPEILLVTGLVGGVVSAVMACKATTKFSTILEKPKKQLDDMREYVAEKGYSEEYTEQDHKKDIAITYAHTCWDIAKLYGPSVILGAASVTCILASHNIIHKRNVAYAASVTALNDSFNDYRKNVRDRFGEKLDRELRYNLKSKEIEERVVNEDGTEEVVKRVVETIDEPKDKKTQGHPSIWARYFDDSNRNFDPDDHHYNMTFLRNALNMVNSKLRTDGYLYVNDVYDILGFQRTKEGAYHGWVYDEAHPVGDNFVDFGIYDVYKENSRDFVNGHEKYILLDFNVDGVVYELLQ